MNTKTLPVALTLAFAGAALGQSPPSYVKDVKPFLTKFCAECHNATDMQGELSLESHKLLMAGGKNGPVLVPGKADKSRIVGMVEGKLQPQMPPRKARQPSDAEKKVL